MGRNPHWYGMLCAETIEEIRERLIETLGGKFFTEVTLNSLSTEDKAFRMVDIRASQRFNREPEVKEYSKGQMAVSWSTHRYVESISTTCLTRQEAWDGGIHDWVAVGFDYNKVVIEQYAPAGYFLRWEYHVENHEED